MCSNWESSTISTKFVVRVFPLGSLTCNGSILIYEVNQTIDVMLDRIKFELLRGHFHQLELRREASWMNPLMHAESVLTIWHSAPEQRWFDLRHLITSKNYDHYQIFSCIDQDFWFVWKFCTRFVVPALNGGSREWLHELYLWMHPNESHNWWWNNSDLLMAKHACGTPHMHYRIGLQRFQFFPQGFEFSKISNNVYL